MWTPIFLDCSKNIFMGSFVCVFCNFKNMFFIDPVSGNKKKQSSLNS